MKKSVIVLCFALCGTLAFAQTKHAPARTMQKTQNVAAIQTRDNIREAKPNYKASIFNTKAGGDVRMECDFSTENTGYSTGTIGAGQTIINLGFLASVAAATSLLELLILKYFPFE